MAEEKAKKEKIPRQPMPEQEPDVRKRNFEEVPFGYSKELAIKEAERCLQCKKPSCIAGCPVSVDIPGFIELIKEGEFTKFGHSCIVSPSGRILAGIEEGEGVVVQNLTIEDVDEWRQIATYLKDRKDHLDLYRKQLDL